MILSLIRKQYSKVQSQIITLVPQLGEVLTTSKRDGLGFLASFFVLSIQGLIIMFYNFGQLLLPYIGFITLVSLVGENIVSSKGHYTYNTGRHILYVGIVPISILFLWIGSIAGPYSGFYILLIGNNQPTSIMLWTVSILAAMSSMIFDFIILEPLAYKKRLWLWRNKHRFYAPAKNYAVWFIFPLLANLLLSLELWLISIG